MCLSVFDVMMRMGVFQEFLNDYNFTIKWTIHVAITKHKIWDEQYKDDLEIKGIHR